MEIKRKAKRFIRRTASLVMASVMVGGTTATAAMAAPSAGAAQSFSMGKVGSLFSSAKKLLTGDTAIEKDTHKKADTFASKRLIVKANKLKNIDKKKVIASYNGYYLLKFKSAKAAKKAYNKYEAKSDGKTAIAADQPVHVASGTSADAGGLRSVTKKDNPLSELKENVGDITKKEVKQAEKKRTIALLDTGASRSKNVIESVSMLGGSAEDDNGHGTEMVKAITKENKNAQIISVKVLDRNGEGSVSSIVSGIAYAEKRGASIVNLSLSGLATAGNSVVTAAVNDAIAKRMIVVGAAGNNGRDAKYYIPGCITAALIVGACDEKGIKIESSNYGSTVDYNIVADSTSEATAKMSGYLSAHFNKDGSYSLDENDNNLIFTPDYTETKKRKSCVEIGYTDKEPDIEIYLYGDKKVDKIGKRENKYSAEGVYNSFVIRSKEYAVSVTYPNGEVQYYSNKKTVINLADKFESYGNYVISPIYTEAQMRSILDSDPSAKLYKKPHALKAIQKRYYNTKFTAQADQAPDHIHGTIIPEDARTHGTARKTTHFSPFTIRAVHIDGVKDSDVTWTGKLVCHRHKYPGPNGSPVKITDSWKLYTKNGWTWYKVDTQAVSHPEDYQYYYARVAVRFPIHIDHVEVNVVKKWKNTKENDKKPVKVKLIRSGGGGSNKTITTQTLNESNNWKYNSGELPANTDSGKNYSYKWVEITKLKNVNTKITKEVSGSTTTYTITNDTKYHVPDSQDYKYKASKVWVGDDEPDDVEVKMTLTYDETTYPVDSNGNRTSNTPLSTEKKSKDEILNAGNGWEKEDAIHVPNKDKTVLSNFRWYETQWKSASESGWHDGPPPHWALGDSGDGYPRIKSVIVNAWAPTTTMYVHKEWETAPIADNVVEHLWGRNPETGNYDLDCGTVTLNEANDWSASISNLYVYYSRNNKGVLDYHVPMKYDDGDYVVDDETADIFKIDYKWVEEKATDSGMNVQGLIASSDHELEQYDREDPVDGGQDINTNISVTPSIASDAVDASTNTKIGRVSVDANGHRHLNVKETVKIDNVAPSKTYTLYSMAMGQDGNDTTEGDFRETQFIPMQQSTFTHDEGTGTTSVILTINMDLQFADWFNPAGQKIVIGETLYDQDSNLVATELNPNNDRQAIYYPEIKTHMMSLNPSKNYGHTMDAIAGDSDGNHFGTLLNSPNGTITMRDTVTYKNVPRGYRFTLDGVLHRRGRTERTGEDLGPVVVDGKTVTGETTFDVPGGDGVTASGEINVDYTFRFPENLYGGDYVSFETLKYNGIDIVDHSDISDGKQTVRMPTSFRIDKRDADTDQPVANVTYQLFTKDGAGNLIAYKKDDGNDYLVTTGSDGTGEFRNLDIGTYWVVERKTPRAKGKRYYSLQKSAFEMNAVESKVNSKKNTNFTTPELTTGGKGTVIFYISAALIAGMCLILVFIKKRGKE